jgi:hypothetical protein
MLQIQGFVFNFASENTYILYNENKNAWLIDPGNMNEQETQAIDNLLRKRFEHSENTFNPCSY